MYGFILGYPLPLYLIEIPDLLESFGQVCGNWWTPDWRRTQHFIHKQMVEQRWPIGQWSGCSGVIAASIPSFGMNTCVMCNMLTTVLNILLHKDLLLRLVLVLHQSLPRILSLVKILQLMEIVMWTKQPSSMNRYKKFTRQCRNSWREAKASTKQGMISIESSIASKLVIKSGCTSTKMECKVKGRS